MNILWSRVNTFLENKSSPALTENRYCPICGHSRAKTVVRFNNFQFYSDTSSVPNTTNIQQQQCERCCCLFMNPVYTQEGYDILFAKATASFGNSEGRPSDQANWLKQNTHFSRYEHIIDLGCHTAEFIQNFHELNSATGVDIDTNIINQLTSTNINDNIQYIACDFTTQLAFDLPRNCIITLLHVLEHLIKPYEFLLKLKSRVHSESILYVEVPILELGNTNDINGFFSVTHLTHFSRSSLKHCLNSAGWKILYWQEQSTYNGCRVLLEPNNALIDNNCNYDQGDVVKTITLIDNWNDNIRQACARINPILNFSNCVIWGAGLHTELVYQATDFFPNAQTMEFILVDIDKNKQGSSWRGIKTYSPNILELKELNDIPVLISSYRNQDEIRNSIIRIRGNDSNIFLFYDCIRSY